MTILATRAFRLTACGAIAFAFVAFVARAAYQVFFVSPASTYTGGRGLQGWYVSVLVLAVCLVVALLIGSIHWVWCHYQWRLFGAQMRRKPPVRDIED